MDKFKAWLQTSAGKGFGIAASLIFVIVAAWVTFSTVAGGIPGDPNNPTYICSETGKPFRHKLVIGESIPVMSPFSGKETGYPAEPCYWTKDGGKKSSPTWVLVNASIGKPGPTFCPDCDRLVVGHNPEPGPTTRVPPTRTDYLRGTHR